MSLTTDTLLALPIERVCSFCNAPADIVCASCPVDWLCVNCISQHFYLTHVAEESLCDRPACPDMAVAFNWLTTLLRGQPVVISGERLCQDHLENQAPSEAR